MMVERARRAIFIMGSGGSRQATAAGRRGASCSVGWQGVIQYLGVDTMTAAQKEEYDETEQIYNEDWYQIDEAVMTIVQRENRAGGIAVHLLLI